MSNKKQIYLAPLQGYTNVFYRKALNEVYSGVAKYFTPFFEEGKGCFSDPELNPELDMNLNAGCYLVPQIATNNIRFLIAFSKKIKELGYEELNLNMGCPFPMLVKRSKGGGMLSDTHLVEQLLAEFFQQDIGLRLSVKMRSGLTEVNQGLRMLGVLNQFPLHEIIVHPRLVIQKYNGHPNWDDFEMMLKATSIPMVANGDIVCRNDVEVIQKNFLEVKSIMIGRGILSNPGSILLEKEENTVERFLQFHKLYYDLVQSNTLNWNQAFNYLSDFWFYPLTNTTEGKRYFRKLKKHNHLDLYQDWLYGVKDHIHLK
ncbi:tRNA-dihydrouridine synthase family protein [Carboxylicivirga linearis]|uniref:tRNA-dihydrouridine synthase n=1 Tax=Carboxylicivirga linearis TaxID=1628157 RepID=A0ABS5JX41_9BACT|nr:tRNA-dihydrouridine synthase family protein [Carboxylicivirga linearis]MBS2099031.1 tRNA-dihydrouridine synthase family protein [Carboxylicivirga linearis]